MASFIDQIKALNDRDIVKVEKIPGWKDIVLYIRPLSSNDVAAYEKAKKDNPSMDWRAHLVILSACDESGNKSFSDKDMGWLSGKNVKALNYIVDKINQLIWIDTEELENKVKNS